MCWIAHVCLGCSSYQQISTGCTVPSSGESPCSRWLTHSLSVACSFSVFWALPGVDFAVAQGQPMTHHARHWLETANCLILSSTTERQHEFYHVFIPPESSFPA